VVDCDVLESLRKYPPIPFITRTCVKDYNIPDTDAVLEKGRRVLVPILGVHHDEEYYPDPHRFDPDRFNEENKRARNQYSYIPFGEGPRTCIGEYLQYPSMIPFYFVLICRDEIRLDAD
jgi:cytochrome P450 family 6